MTRKSKKKEGRQIKEILEEFVRSGGSHLDFGVLGFKHFISLPVLPVVQDAIKGHPSGGQRRKAAMKEWLRQGSLEHGQWWGRCIH